MESPGRKLKQARERLQLRYRDVVEASKKIAARRGRPEYAIGLSRLADIENKGVVPSIYRLYSLCAVYRLGIEEVVGWYGVDLAQLGADAAGVALEATHLIQLDGSQLGEVTIPKGLDPDFDLRQTAFLSRVIQRWGRIPLTLLNEADLKHHRFGFIGTDDWFMHPLLAPGSFVWIDESRRKITQGGWETERERPIYFFEHRSGYACGWASLAGERLILQPHPGSRCPARSYIYPAEIDVVGQVTAYATRLAPAARRRTRS